MNQTDPRAGLPSASKLERIVACPGSPAMEASLPADQRDVIEPPDEWAERGSRIHKAHETGDTSELNEEELETYTRGCAFEQQIVSDWQQTYQVQMYEKERELRLWVHDRDLNAIGSAQLDLLMFNRKQRVGCVLDYKSGYNPNLSPSPKSFQLRLQAIAARQEYDLELVRVGFVKGKQKAFGTDWCDYTAQDLDFAEQQVFFHLWESRQEDAPRRAGKWCGNCPAKSFCAEAGAYSLLPSVIANRSLRITDKETAKLAVESLMPPDLLRIWSMSTTVGHVLDAVKARLKAMPEADLKELGLELGPGRPLDPVVNTREAVEYLKGKGFDEDMVWFCLSMSKTAVADMVKQRDGITKEAATAYVRQNLAPYIEKKTSEKILRLLK